MDGQNPFEELNERLRRLEEKVDELRNGSDRSLGDLMSIDDLSAYTGLSRSYLHKLSSSGELQGYKPLGKKLYFDREEIDAWLKRGKKASSDELDRQAADHLNKKKGGRG